MKFDEDYIQQKSICGLMNLKDAPNPIFPFAVDALRWGLLERFNGSIPDLASIRSKLSTAWATNNKYKSNYWEGQRATAGIASRIYKLLLKYDCVRPIEPYKLLINNIDTIEGIVGIVRRSGKGVKNPKTYVLDILRTSAGRRPIITDYRSLARWLYIRQDYDSPQLDILHMPLLYGEYQSSTQPNELLAKQWLSGIIKQQAQSLLFPQIGNHCRDCTKPCKDLLYG